MKTKVIILLTLILSHPTWAAHSWSPAVKVDTLQVSPDGDVLITLETDHNDVECGSSGTDLKRIWLKKASNDAYESVFSLSLTAVALNADMYFRANGCTGSVPNVEYARLDN